MSAVQLCKNHADNPGSISGQCAVIYSVPNCGSVLVFYHLANPTGQRAVTHLSVAGEHSTTASDNGCVNSAWVQWNSIECWTCKRTVSEEKNTACLHDK